MALAAASVCSPIPGFRAACPATPDGVLVPTASPSTMPETQPPRHDSEWDAGDLGCGELVIGLRFRLKALRPGQVIRLHATDIGAIQDLPAWCRMTGDTLLLHDPAGHLYYVARGAY